jgi:HdeA/HdeB family
MTKNSSMIFSVLGASAIAVFSMTAQVEAKKLGDWTCYDFIKAPSGQKSSVVYFFTGINLADRKDTLDLAAKDFNVPVTKVTQYCQTHRSEPLWPAIINYFNLP